MTFKQRLAAIATLLATFTAIAGGLSLVGKEVRLVDVLTLFATGFGSGASVVAIKCSMTKKNTANE